MPFSAYISSKRIIKRTFAYRYILHAKNTFRKENHHFFSMLFQAAANSAQSTAAGRQKRNDRSCQNRSRHGLKPNMTGTGNACIEHSLTAKEAVAQFFLEENICRNLQTTAGMGFQQFHTAYNFYSFQIPVKNLHFYKTIAIIVIILIIKADAPFEK